MEKLLNDDRFRAMTGGALEGSQGPSQAVEEEEEEVCVEEVAPYPPPGGLDPHSTGEMDNSTKVDSHFEILDILAPAIIALIPGLLIHSFIIVTNVTDWWKGRSVMPVDHIVTVLGISRMGMQCTDFFYMIGLELLMRSSNSYFNQDVLNSFYFFFHYTNIWLTTLLLIVLCLKISNIKTRLFLYLKGMILPRTVHFIAASVLLAAFNILMLFVATLINVTSPPSQNTTMDNQQNECLNISSIVNFTLGSLFPLFFYFISSILLFTSLYYHTVKMKMSSNLSINLESYYSAMKLVIFTFIYNSIYLIGHFLCAFFYYFQCVTYSWPYIILDFLPVLHSSYMIYRTAKLWSQMSKVLQNVNAFIFQRKDTEPREKTQVANN
ncbi:taste receptor type 2 member 2-like [Phyllobates terribilis]|uniref:taste receptor type 2 member 2-like n=1 Tax=Phyllobates terribilis TaxID=111132 RepID=UPI003CCABA42